MNTPATLGAGHALYPVHAALVLQAGKDIFASDMGHHFLYPAQFGRLLFDNVELPSARFGIAVVHAQQIGGEQCGLIAPRAGPDLKHRGARVSLVLWQQRQLQGSFGSGQRAFDLVDLVAGHSGHFGIGQHLARACQIVQQHAVGVDLVHDRAQIAVFFCQFRNIATGSGHGRFEVLETGGDLGKAVHGYHGLCSDLSNRFGQVPRYAMIVL